MTRFAVMTFTSLLALAGCVVSPSNDSRVASRTEAVSFQGFATQPSATIILTTQNFVTGKMEEFARATSQSTALIQKDTWGNGQHPALYYWSVKAPVAQAANKNLRWRPANLPCNDTGGGPVNENGGIGSSTSPICAQTYEANIIVEEPGGMLSRLYTFPEGGIKCTTDKVEAGGDFLRAAYECSTGGANLRLLTNL